MKGLDFKDWYKISEDKQSTTLKHSKGHVMTIAHAALPKIQQEQLKRIKMADGGKADDVPEPNKKSAQEFSKGASESGAPSVSEAYNNIKSGLGFAEGGSVESWTKREDNEKGINKGHAGMHIKHGEGDEDSIGAAKLSHKKVLKEMKEMPPRKLYADSPEPVSKDDNAPNADNSQSTNTGQPITINVGTHPVIPQNLATDEPLEKKDTAPSAPVNQQIPQSQPIQAANRDLVEQNAANTLAAGQAAKAANLAAVPIAQAQANITGPAEHELAEIQKTAAQHYQNQYQQLAQHAQAYENYINQHPPNPNAYLENMGAGRKMATAVGLMLGGMGQGLIGGDNPALTFLNSQIQNNIEAQKQRADQQKTVWGAYNDLYHNGQVATNMATVAEINRVGHMVNMQAARLKTLEAARQAKLFNSNLQMEKDGLFQKSAGIITQNGGSPGTPTAGQSIEPQGLRKDLDYTATPGSGRIPDLGQPPQFHVNYKQLQRHKNLAGTPGYMSAEEARTATDEAGALEQNNSAVRELHKQLGIMYANADGAAPILKYIGHQGLFGFSLPDLTSLSPAARKYGAAAAAVKKQLASIVLGGGNSELYSLIQDQFPTGTTEPDEFRNNVATAENAARQQVRPSILRAYEKVHPGLVSGLLGEE